MSDLKAPTYEYQSARESTCPPVGRAFTVRYFIFSRSDIFQRRWRTEDVGPEGADLRRPTCHHITVAQDASRRSGLYGPTAIFSRSDIFKRRWRTEDVGPEGADLRIPMPSRNGIQG
jgi:hypothetical protein